MEDLDIKNEIEFRMNPSDFSVSPSDLIEIMNTFNIDENKVVEIYSEVVSERKEELKNTTEEVLEYLRNSGNYNPSFRDFKEMFDEFEPQPINDKFLIDMYKKATTDENQLSLFEIIQDEIKKVMSESYNDEDDFDIAASKISKNWGGSTRPKEKFDAAEFFGNAGDAAEADIRDEFGDDEFAAFGSMEDPRMLRDLDAISNEMDEAIDGKGLFQVEDAEGNIIKKGDLITPATGVNKKGRIIGLGDDGAGNMQLSVSWEWPIEMKFTNPEEMGEEKVYPKDVVLASLKQMKENDSDYGGKNLRGVKVTYADGTVIPTSMAAHLTDDEIYKYFKKGKMFNIGNGELDNMQAVADVEILKENDEELPGGELSFDTKSLYHWFQDALYQLDGYDEAAAAEIMEKAFKRDYDYKLKMSEMKDKKSELDESGDGEGLEIKNQEEEIDEARGLGKGVKNSGDRNVKLRDDHHSAPLTNINESLDGKIKNLIEGKITKRQLQDFIREQAKEVAKKLK